MCECQSHPNFLQTPLVKLKNCSSPHRKETEILNVIQELKAEKIRHLKYRHDYALKILNQSSISSSSFTPCIFVDAIQILEDNYIKDVLEYRKYQKILDQLKEYIQEENEFRSNYKKQYETELKPFLEFNQIQEDKLQTVSYLTGKDRESDRLEKIEKEKKKKKNKRKSRN
jgi:hypothetical protein